jgi:hypothetical protein
MPAPDDDDKRILRSERTQRLAKGGTSTFAITIIVSSVYAKYFKEEMDPNLAVAIATITGSMSTGFVLCFKDMRALFCGWLIRKRYARNRRRV